MDIVNKFLFFLILTKTYTVTSTKIRYSISIIPKEAPLVMKHPIFRRAGTLALLGALLIPQAGALSDVSNWAQEGGTAATAM